MWPFGPRNEYPYTDFHELNTDWILKKICQFDSMFRNYTKEISNAVDKWLTDHPEATTTVQDHSLTNEKLVNGTLNFVTPEMYGAVGDGVTDDTTAWQDAVDSGYPVLAKSDTYRTGTINVTSDTVIDCNNATFICIEKTLFECTGTAENGVLEANYTAYTPYDLSDSYTGIAMIKGNNNVFPQRNYYYGGSIESFVNGRLQGTIPVNITSPLVYKLNTIKVDIRNIKEVSFDTDDIVGARVIHQIRCAFSNISNINVSNTCYSVITFDTCFKCSIEDCNIVQPDYYGIAGDNYYPIAIIDSCYTIIRNTYVYCIGWHAVSTGGEILCRRTEVVNCELYSDYTTGYDDHENAIETIIKDSTVSAILAGALCNIDNVKITGGTSAAQAGARGRISLHMYAIEKLAEYTLKNISFDRNTGAYHIYGFLEIPSASGYAADYYWNKLTVSNCKTEDGSDVVISVFLDPNHTGTITYNELFIDNTKNNVNTVIFNRTYNTQMREHRFNVNSKYYFFYKVDRTVHFTSPQDITLGDAGVNVIGTLPNEYRPTQNVIIPVANATDATYMNIRSDGIVQLVLSSAASSARNGAFSGSWYTNN